MIGNFKDPMNQITSEIFGEIFDKLFSKPAFLVDKVKGSIMNDKVVYLEFKNKNTIEEGFINFVACANCRNKTYVLIEDEKDQFPLLKCSACGNEIGRIGWAN